MRSLLLLLLAVPPLFAARSIAVEGQNAALSSTLIDPQRGLLLQAKVRDLCRLQVQNLWHFDGLDESGRPCSDWRPLEPVEPTRTLRPTPSSGRRAVRGPTTSGEIHRLVADVTRPPGLQGNVIPLEWEDGRWLLRAESLGELLVVAELNGAPVESLALRVTAHVQGNGEALPVRWAIDARPDPVDDLAIDIDAAQFETLGEGWRCAAMAALPPGMDPAVPLERRLRYTLAHCPQARAHHEPALCAELIESLQGADLDTALIAREDAAGIWGACRGPAHARWIDALYKGALDERDLLTALGVVQQFGPEMDREWTSAARAHVESRIRAEVPDRFDWALYNGATEQARGLIRDFGAILGPEWSARARARVQ